MLYHLSQAAQRETLKLQGSAYFDKLSTTIPSTRYGLYIFILISPILLVIVFYSVTFFILFGQSILNWRAPDFILLEFIGFILAFKMLKKKFFQQNIQFWIN